MLHFDPTAIDDVFTVGIGLAVFNSDAFGQGAASLPGPLTDADYDWIYHRLVQFTVHTATESDDSIMQNVQIEVDSKAMRKIKPNQSIGWMVEGLIVSGGGTFDGAIVARHLFKLG